MKPPLGTSTTLPSWKTRRRVLTAAMALVSGTLMLFFISPSQDSARHVRFRTLQEAECTVECCRAFESSICPVENQWVNVLPVGVQYFLIVLLIMLSASFSGLTLGLMSLDKTGLEIVMEGEDEKNAKAARRIYPVRKKGNWLLCTLLLGNTAVNAMLSILMAAITGGIVGFLVSTFLIVIFGEIIPQALCSRFALEIGSRMVPLVKVIMILFYPVARPMAWCLDKALGDELPTTYSSTEMRKLLEIHVAEGRFDQETAEAMTGALKYKQILVKDVMTSIDKTFMLNVDERLNFECIATIFKTGYSRIPVYEISKNNIIGILFVKDLIFIDPEDETPIRNFIQIFGRGAHVVWPDDTLGDVLRELKQGRSHMALVQDVNNEDESQDPFYEIKGIITLEDIIEEILGDEIVDETDAFVDGTHSVRVDRMGESFDWGRLRLLDSKIVDETLSYEEAKAVTAHLRTNYQEAMSLLSDNQLYRLVSETSVTTLNTAIHDVGSEVPNELLYEKGAPTDVCTLVLSGKVTVLAGVDKFRSDVSSWTVLASAALNELRYSPDFTAFVSGGPCRCLRFSRERYIAAVDASALERRRMSHDSGDLSREESKSVHEVASQASEAGESAHSEGEQLETRKRQASPKRRETQLRRNKLIAAFQKAAKVDTKEESPPKQEEVAEKESSSRDKSVRFVSPAGGLSERSDSPSSLRLSSPPKAPSQRSDDETKETRSSIRSRRSSFDYIESGQTGASQDDAHDGS